MCSTEFVTTASRCKIPAQKLAFGMHWEKHFQMCQLGIYNVQVGYDMLWCFYKRILGHKIHKHRDTMQITSTDSLAWWSNISSVTSWNLCWKTPFWKHGGYWCIHIYIYIQCISHIYKSNLWYFVAAHYRIRLALCKDRTLIIWQACILENSRFNDLKLAKVSWHRSYRYGSVSTQRWEEMLGSK